MNIKYTTIQSFHFQTHKKDATSSAAVVGLGCISMSIITQMFNLCCFAETNSYGSCGMSTGWKCSSKEVQRMATHGVLELSLCSERPMFWKITLHTIRPTSLFLWCFHHAFVRPQFCHLRCKYHIDFHLRRWYSSTAYDLGFDVAVFCRRSWRWRIVRMGLQAGWRYLLLLAINPRRTVLSLIDLLWMAIVCRAVCVYLLSRGVAFPTPLTPNIFA